MLAKIDLEHEWEIKCLINPEAFLCYCQRNNKRLVSLYDMGL